MRNAGNPVLWKMLGLAGAPQKRCPSAINPPRPLLEGQTVTVGELIHHTERARQPERYFGNVGDDDEEDQHGEQPRQHR
jgi:hypothetical protein